MNSSDTHSPDVRLIPPHVKVDHSLDANMAKLAAECERDGHTWDGATARFCIHCGAVLSSTAGPDRGEWRPR
jgi:hypothetical protein